MPKVNLTPQNMSAVIEQLMKDIDETQAKFNRVLLQQAEREAHLLQQLGAANEKLNDALARIKELEKKMDGRTTAKNVMNAREASEYLELKGPASIYNKMRLGQIEGHKQKGGRYVFPVAALRAYKEGRLSKNLK